MRGLLALAAVLTALGSPAGSDDVHRVSLSATRDGRSSSWVEWVAPGDGRWRVERPDETAVFSGGTHALKRDVGVSIRTGSTRFLAPVAKQSIALDVVRSYLAGRADEDGIEVGTAPDGKTELRFRRNGVSVVARLEETIGLDEAGRRRLFAVPPGRVLSRDVERAPGARPTLLARAYWFGRRLGGRAAVSTLEHFDHYPGRPPTRVYLTLYAGGLQVSSQDVRSHLARKTIAAFNGRNGDLRYPPWPRSRVRLASTGESVTVVQDLGEDAGPGRRRFIAITRTTLVAVNQGFIPARIPAVARALRPVG